MLTSLDIKKLQGIFATKDDFNRLKSDFNRLENNFNRLENGQKKFVTRKEFVTGFDAIMHELKAIREELTVGSYRRSENSEAIDDHEERISSIEGKLSF